MSSVDSKIITIAEEQLADAQESAGVTMRLLHSAEETAEASLLLDEVWNVGRAGTTQLEPGLLVALAHSGNYVAAAFDSEDDTMIGVTVGFFGEPLGKMMHSHIAGVRHEHVGRGTGAAMKLHQRLWCLNRGIRQMTWTFDPLIARNANFNFSRLGVNALEYFEDFYGQMRDGVNEGQASDRLLVSWRLDIAERRPTVGEADLERANCLLDVDDTGEPLLKREIPRSTEIASIRIPVDMESLRGDNPELASRWRFALRDGLTGLLDDGWEISGFLKNGTYLLTHPDDDGPLAEDEISTSEEEGPRA
ncbi:hypothetical protein GCM10022261_05520 [Brevibacterium daeguense]|uniref:GNAT family N-acetyltransferase n=1 Tax=Brevibacterium daeguense TaxID=909936 RepID=A0ABP8EGQ1_9MICO|nr:hypothetical protein [Brevibacterium daeguense]